MSIRKTLQLVVATDYSPTASNACRYAVSFAHQTKAKITFIHLFKYPVINTNMTADFTRIREHFKIDEELKLNEYKNEIIKSLNLKPDEVDSSVEVIEGNIAKDLVRMAERIKADFILTGTHGTSGLRNFIVGDHAWKIIQKSTIPVILIPKNSIFRGFKNIILGVEGKDVEVPVFNFIVDFAKKNNSHISAIHINKKSDTDLIGFEKTKQNLTEIIRKNDFENFDLSVHDKGNIIQELKKISIHKKADCLVFSNDNSVRIENVLPSLFRKTKKMSLQTRVPMMIIPTSYVKTPLPVAEGDFIVQSF